MTTPEIVSTQATFGELLRRWRRANKLSQAAFGELLVPRVRNTTVSCWENGSRCPSLRYLSQVVAVTGIPANLALGLPGPGQEAGRP